MVARTLVPESAEEEISRVPPHSRTRSLHTQQPERTAPDGTALSCANVKTHAVISNLQLQCPLAVTEFNPDILRFGMAHHVGKRLLRHAEERGFNLRGKALLRLAGPSNAESQTLESVRPGTIARPTPGRDRPTAEASNQRTTAAPGPTLHPAF